MPEVLIQPRLPQLRDTRDAPTWLRFLRAGAIGAAIASIANILVFALARLAGVDFMARFDPVGVPESLRVGNIVIVCIFAAIGATIFFAVIQRFMKRWVIETFLIVSALFLLLSLGSPLSLPEATVATRAVLLSMHFLAALAIVTPLVLMHRQPHRLEEQPPHEDTAASSPP